MSHPTEVTRTVLDLFLSGSRLPVEAIEKLIAGDESVENVLAEVICSPAVREDSWAVVWALIALGERRSKRALPPILYCMRTATDLVHEAVEFALLRFGLAAVNPILDFLEENPAHPGRIHLYAVLAASRSPRALDYLIGQLRRDEDCVAAIAWQLAETRQPRAIAAIEREAERLGAREPDVAEALEAARGKEDFSNPLLADWHKHWKFEDDDDSSEDSEEELETMRDEEDGLNLQPRYFDLRCPVCESQIEYDSKEDRARVLRGSRGRRPS